MILISNRGNVDGSNPELENKQDYIQMAINKGFKVKVDLWLKDNAIYLGSDKPEYKLDIDWLERNASKLLLQCRDIELLERLVDLDPMGVNLHMFTYNGEVTMTNKSYIWGHNSTKSIALLGERSEDEVDLDYYGVCSDYISSYKK